ncbi:MAG: Zn-dependent membrane protease YugP [Kiritimatiellia bacterium]|jgi:Zn-dependent membrane protease YugP
MMMYLLLVMLPGLVLGGLASFLTKSTFKKYSRKTVRSGMTGAQAAQTMLERNGVHDVKIEEVAGFLSDHYDPRNKTLRLSPAVYQEASLSAIGVACHEAGHALQHAQGYAALKMRSALVPVTGVTSSLAMPLLMVGMMLNFKPLLLVGVVLFSGAVLFSIVTLPVEWDATARAKKLMVPAGIVTEAEREDSGKVLNAAFLTYLASTITAILTLIYYLYRAGLIGGRR